MEKMMTFEEWWNEAYGDREIPVPRVEIVKIWASQAFESARKGTIPAENAVVIPPVGEWPEWAIRIVVQYQSSSSYHVPIKEIPRPKPVWVPQVGEAVFYLHDLDAVGVDVISRIDTLEDKTSYWMTSNVSHGWFSVKPFHESHIGKPWSEIPGGME